MFKLSLGLLAALLLSACGDNAVEVSHNGSGIKLDKEGVSLQAEGNAGIVISEEQGIRLSDGETQISLQGDTAKQIVGGVQDALKESGEVFKTEEQEK